MYWNGNYIIQTTPKYLDGFLLMGDECLADIQLECPPGFWVKGKNYISTENPKCPLGLKCINTNCIYYDPPSCPPGTSQDRN
jgi:hypothetical protein